MQSTTVRISHKSRVILQEIVTREKESMQTILQKALENYRRQVFLKKCSDAYAALKADDKTWKAELSEQEAWDSTIGDGLEEDL